MDQNKRNDKYASSLGAADYAAYKKMTFQDQTKIANNARKANIKSGIGSVSNIVGSAADSVMGSLVETQASKGKNPTGFETQQQIGNALMASGNPYAMAAGAAYKIISGVAEATGGNVNTIKKEQAEDLGISGAERIANNVLGILHPGAG